MAATGTHIPKAWRPYSIKLLECTRRSCIERWNLVAGGCVAVKRIVLSQNQQRHVWRQCCFMESVAPHPYILGKLGEFSTSNELVIVHEFCSRGDLHHILTGTAAAGRRFTVQQVRDCAVEIVLALEHMRAHDFIHRDIKLENVLIGDDGHLRICDFESVAYASEAPHFELLGTVSSFSPEVVRSSGHDGQTDMWALGVVMYVMCYGKLPFGNSHSVFNNIVSARMPPLRVDGARLVQDMTLEMCTFIASLLVRDSSARLSLDSVREARVFHGVDWTLGAQTPPFPPLTTTTTTG